MNEAVAFYILATLIVAGSAMMLRTTNIVHSAFWLLGALLATAGIYALLSAGFLAIMQIFIYAGAVTVLLLFVIMLTGTGVADVEAPGTHALGAGIVALALAAILVPLQIRAPWVLPGTQVITDTSVLGRLLFSNYLLPFELASIVLLVALVGAIFLAREEQ